MPETTRRDILMTRRAWLQRTPTALAALAAGCDSFDGFRWGESWGASAQAPPRPKPPIIDSHVHLFAADESRFPFHTEAPYIPEYRSPVNAYMRHMRDAGVDRAVLVHPEPYQNDHRYVMHCLTQAPDHFRATCLFDPNSPETPAALMELCETPGFAAFRIHAYREEHLPDFDSSILREVWDTAVRLGLVLQLHGVPKHLPRFAPLIRDYPQGSVVIDHLGRPGQGTPEEIEEVLRLAALPNVFMKFSGLAHASKQPFPHADLKPFLQGVVDLFTPARMLWGDSYRGQPYSSEPTAVETILDFVHESGRNMIAGGTAARLFRFA